MERSTRSEAVAVLLAVVAGAGIGYALFLSTSSSVLAIGMASPVAVLVNNYVRNKLRAGKE